jgi:hypothetical protein
MAEDDDKPDPAAEGPSVGQVAADIALSEGVSAARGALERRLASHGYAQKDIDEIVAGKESFGARFAAAAIARLATRSLPGALAVGGASAAARIPQRWMKRANRRPVA